MHDVCVCVCGVCGVCVCACLRVSTYGNIFSKHLVITPLPWFVCSKSADVNRGDHKRKICLRCLTNSGSGADSARFGEVIKYLRPKNGVNEPEFFVSVPKVKKTGSSTSSGSLDFISAEVRRIDFIYFFN